MGIAKDYKQKGEAKKQRVKARLDELGADIKEGIADTKIKARRAIDNMAGGYD